MSETWQVVLANVAPAFLFIAFCVAVGMLVEKNAEIRDLEDERDQLRDLLEPFESRADELTRRRHERIQSATADGATFVPGQRRAGDWS